MHNSKPAVERLAQKVLFFVNLSKYFMMCITSLSTKVNPIKLVTSFEVHNKVLSLSLRKKLSHKHVNTRLGLISL
jgi:hypothetical protein